MIVTDDDRLADACRSMRNQGRPVISRGAGDSASLSTWLTHERLGYNYRLSEIHAALGAAQMSRLDEILSRRRQVACMYFEKLMDLPDIILPNVHDHAGMSWFVYVIRLCDPYGPKERDRIMVGLRRHEVGCSNYFPPIHLQPFYRQKFGFAPGDFPVTEAIAGRTIALPFFTRMEPTQVELTALTLQVMLQRESLLKPRE
jgi:perosamine synthetase